ncbi:MAG: 4Fe-4S ferredoxin, partial [Syntrophobacteraceae bacterium]|nr:4Fe-4S ferredoxin [Syntrophobacteraceae bacterium]
MTSTVYYGSPRQSRLEASETLPAKLDLILEKLQLRERVKGESVCLKLHVG